MTAISLSIKHDWPDLQRKIDRQRKDIADKAMARALNKTIDQGRAEMARRIAAEYRIKISDVRQRLAITRARKQGKALELTVSLEATRAGKGRSMNLIAFHTGGGRVLKSGKRQQLRFKIRRDGGNKQITGAFIGNKGRTIFIRDGKSRLPIKAVNTIDVVQMFNAKRINLAVREALLASLESNFDRELRVVLGGYAQ